MPGDEQVLVVPRAEFERLGVFQGLCLDVGRYLEALLAPGVPRFMPRATAEVDPAFKQLIPYVLMTCAGRYLSYVRGKRAGEQRLVGCRSLGIGGHINPVDEAPLYEVPWREVYAQAVQREVREELIVDAAHTDGIVAFLNDDSTDVGRVHLGIVHLWTLDAPNVRKRESMITQPEFLSRAELRAARPDMESWSAFCVDHLDDIERHSKCATTSDPVHILGGQQ